MILVKETSHMWQYKPTANIFVSADCLEDKMEYRGQYLTNMVSKGPGDCQKKCQENKACTFWSMATKNIYDWRGWGWGRRRYIRYRPNHCWLLGGKPWGRPRGDFMRGPKVCPKVDGGWSDWKQEGPCSVSCGKGTAKLLDPNCFHS